MKQQELNNNADRFLAQWLAGELTDAELKTLVSDEDFRAFLKLKRGLEAHEALEASTATSFDKIQQRITNTPAKVKTLNTSWWIGIAASLIILFGVFAMLRDDMVTVETNFGEQKTIALLDGSEVILNSKSTLTFDEDDWEANRTLTLDGEAYFKVKKGSTFTVKTQNGHVQVLGTQFNVNAVSDYFEVVCFEGKVGVHTQNEDYVLLPSNSVRRINGHNIETWDTQKQGPTWVEGESSFKSVPLPYVIATLESQYNIAIDASAVDLSQIYTGSFTHKDLNIALKTVFGSLQIQYVEKEKGNIYLSEK